MWVPDESTFSHEERAISDRGMLMLHRNERGGEAADDRGGVRLQL